MEVELVASTIIATEKRLFYIIFQNKFLKKITASEKYISSSYSTSESNFV